MGKYEFCGYFNFPLRLKIQNLIMTDAKPAAKPAAKKATKPKAPAAHPAFTVMVGKAIAALAEKGGSSKIAIVKYIMANYKVSDDKDKVNARVKTALKAGLKSGALKLAKGKSVSGSFKLGKDKAADKGKKAAKKVAAKEKAKAKKAEKKEKAKAKKAKKPA